MVKKDATNPIREKWVIQELGEWDKAHPDTANTIHDINVEVENSADCTEYPKCLNPEVNRCYIRGKVCKNIVLAKEVKTT
jgi:hypothetical protein